MVTITLGALNDTLQTALYMDDTDIEILKMKYKTLHKLRHDTIHVLLHNIIKGENPEKEKTLKESFPTVFFSDPNGKLTPDIAYTSVEWGKHTHTIIDVTVTTSVDNARRTKINKYTSALPQYNWENECVFNDNGEVVYGDVKKMIDGDGIGEKLNKKTSEELSKAWAIENEKQSYKPRTLTEIMREQEQENIKHIFRVFAFCIKTDITNLDNEIEKILRDTGTHFKSDDNFKQLKSKIVEIFEACNKNMEDLWKVNKNIDLFGENETFEKNIRTEWEYDLYKRVRDQYTPNADNLQKAFANEYDNTKEEMENTFIELAEDPEVFNSLKDTKQTPDLFKYGFDKVFREDEEMKKASHAKPTFHIPCAVLSEEELSVLRASMRKSGVNKVRQFFTEKNDFPEQEAIIDLLNFTCKAINLIEVASDKKRVHKEYLLLNHLLGNLNLALEEEGDRNMFCTNKFMIGEVNDTFETEYADFREAAIENKPSSVKTKRVADKPIHQQGDKIKATRVPSKRDFAKEKGVKLREETPTIYKNKCLNMSNKDIGDACLFLDESATDFKRKTNTHRKYKEARNCPLSSLEDADRYYNYLCENVNNGYKVPDMLYNGIGVDSPTAYKLKVDMLEEFHVYLERVSKLRAFQLQWHTHYCASQLLHFTEMNTQQNHIYLFNSGMPNMLHLCRGGSKDRGTDTGQAFFSVYLTFNSLDACSMFGKVKSIPVVIDYLGGKKTLFICITNWRRLSSKKLCFIKDQVYSTLSTGFDTWHRNSEITDVQLTRNHTKKVEIFNIEPDEIREQNKHIYVFRTMVSLCTSQRVAALLMDTRYIFMSCVSDYSSIHELIMEKFAPPYTTAIHRWIVDRLHIRARLIMAYLKQFPMTVKSPMYDSNRQRVQQTLGGNFKMPSLWSNVTLQSVQDMFDEMFVYVHTMKEPSEIHYENVKAIQTINKFQKEFDKLSDNHKQGIHDKESFKKYLLSNGKVGCWSKYIYASARNFAETNRPVTGSKSFDRSTVEESISEIHSTKACIPEYTRKVVERRITEKERKTFQERMNNSNKSNKEATLLEFVRTTKLVLDNKPKFSAIYDSNTNRAKVHDCLYDHLQRNPATKTVLDVAHWNMKSNSSRVVADICIKAQYGSKREFYVLNFGAKCFVRISENIYKSLCLTDQSEMISIPGEQKLEMMENLINKTISMSDRKNDYMFYVNGDCTKWSACETMASFMSMSMGLVDVIGKEASMYTQAVFSKWKNKKITIPTELIKNTRYITEKTEYLKDSVVLDSSQNFLQGMFNYSSSFKASLAVQFAIRMYKKRYPNSNLNTRYMVHSDDYVLMIRCDSGDELETFRVYHKLSQKMHGISDSTKKTNVQRVMMEFISLFSFNGQMCYPRIKKSKEVGLNVSCDDFRSDAMNICSRAGEAIRLGLPMISAYVLQRIHCCCIYEAYSLNKGKQNAFIEDGKYDEIFNAPMELLGLPDCLPLAYSASRGNPNTYRIYLYGESRHKNVIVDLFKLSTFLTNSDVEFEIDDYKDVCNLEEFYNPKYLGVKRKGKLDLIKTGLHLDFKGAKDFFEKHAIYTITKPRNAELFKDWLAAQYYTASFAKAYSKQSRPALSLKLSRYASVACMVMPKIVKKGNRIEVSTVICKMRNIRDIFSTLFDTVRDLVVLDKMVFKQALTCGQTNIQAFYAYMDNTVIKDLGRKRHMPSVSGRLPANIKWQHLNNNPTSVLHFLIDKETFDKDEKQIHSYNAFNRDRMVVEQQYDINRLTGERQNRKYIRLVFKDMTSQFDLGTCGIVFTKNPQVYMDYISSYLAHGISDRTTYQLSRTGDVVIESPSDGHAMIAGLHRDEINPILALTHTIGVLYNFCVRAKRVNFNAFAAWISGVKCTMPYPAFQDKTIFEIFSQIPTESANLVIDNPTINHAHLFLRSLILQDSSCLDVITRNSKHYYKSAYTTVNGVEHLTIVYKQQKFDAIGVNTKDRCPEDNIDIKKLVILKTPMMNIRDWMFVYIVALKEFNVIRLHKMLKLLSGSEDYKLRTVSDLCNLNILKDFAKPGDSFSRRDNNIFEWVSDVPDYPLPILLSSVRQTFVPVKNMEEVQLTTNINVHYGKGEIKNGLSGIYRFPVANLEYYPDILAGNCRLEMFVDKVPLNRILPLQICSQLFKNLELTFIDSKDSDELFTALTYMQGGALDKSIQRTRAEFFENKLNPDVNDYSIRPLTSLQYTHSKLSTIIENANSDIYNTETPEEKEVLTDIRWGLNNSINHPDICEQLIPANVENMINLKKTLTEWHECLEKFDHLEIDILASPTDGYLREELAKATLERSNLQSTLEKCINPFKLRDVVYTTATIQSFLEKIDVLEATNTEQLLDDFENHEITKTLLKDARNAYNEYTDSTGELISEKRQEAINKLGSMGILEFNTFVNVQEILNPKTIGFGVDDFDMDFFDLESLDPPEIEVVNTGTISTEIPFNDKNLRDIDIDLKLDFESYNFTTVDSRTIAEDVSSSLSSGDSDQEVGTTNHFIFKGYTDESETRERYTVRQLRLLESNDLPTIMLKLAFGPEFLSKMKRTDEVLKYLRLYWGLRSSIYNTELEKLVANFVREGLHDFTTLNFGNTLVDKSNTLAVNVVDEGKMGFYRLKERSRQMTEKTELDLFFKHLKRESKVITHKGRDYVATPLTALDMVRMICIVPESLDVDDYPKSLAKYMTNLYKPYSPEQHISHYFKLFV